MLQKLTEFISSIFDGSIIQFKDCENAAEILSSLLKDKLNSISSKNNLILGIPRGGIIIGDIIARKFGYPFHIIIPRKLVSPYNQEVSIGGIMKDNTIYLDTLLIKKLEITDKYLDIEKERQLQEIKKREIILGYQIKEEKIKGKNIILVDDGVATGSTLIVAIRWLRKYEPNNLIVAIPVCPKPTFNLLKDEANDVISIIIPSSKNFNTVDKFYQKFEQLEIEKIRDILSKYNT